MNVAPALPLEPEDEGSVRVRTLFLSDIHLGTRGCQAEALLQFLRHYDADTIFLVGDIVDGWALKSTWYWPQAHNDVVQKLLRKARKGTRLIYIPGNHDEFLREYYGSHFGGVEVVETAIHVTADWRRYLVIHGDLFDVVIKHARWLALLGDKAYDFAIWLNTHFNAVRRAFGVHLLVPLAVGEAESQKRRQLHRCLRTGARERSPAAGGGRRHLRAYSSSGHSPPREARLRKLRGLGGKLHRGRRAARWPACDR